MMTQRPKLTTCIFGCGRKQGPNRGCKGHTGTDVLTVDYDEAVQPDIVADLTVLNDALYLRRGLFDRVVFEALPIDVATNVNTWKNATTLLKSGGILDVRTGNYNKDETIKQLEKCARAAFEKGFPGGGEYEETSCGLSIVWTYF
jgi:hypothetical protein